MTSHHCVKVARLRERKYSNLEEWLNETNNLYVGRRGRIFITHGKDKRIFHYSELKWSNPFKVNDQTDLKTSLEKYNSYLYTSGLFNHISELKGKNLGCFCQERNKEINSKERKNRELVYQLKYPVCHAELLAILANV
jgi:hypothetical protein